MRGLQGPIHYPSSEPRPRRRCGTEKPGRLRRCGATAVGWRRHPRVGKKGRGMRANVVQFCCPWHASQLGIQGNVHRPGGHIRGVNLSCICVPVDKPNILRRIVRLWRPIFRSRGLSRPFASGGENVIEGSSGPHALVWWSPHLASAWTFGSAPGFHGSYTKSY
jgi:hypothetical protein